MKMRLRSLVLGFGVAVLGCGTPIPQLHGCTLVGCDSTLTVSVGMKDAAPWPAGDYAIEIHAGGSARTETCHLTGGPPNLGSCSASGTEQSDPAVRDGRVLFFPRSTAASVTYTVTRDGQTIASGTGAPVYTPQFANGPDCGVTCTHGQLQIDLQ